MSFLERAQSVLLLLAGLYVTLLILLTFPFFQTHVVYLHAIRWPLFADFDRPAKYGLPVHRTVNLNIETSDKVLLGAWLVIPLADYPNNTSNLLSPYPPSSSQLHASLVANPTILYFHGNAATRAVSFRVQHYTSYSSKFAANVLAVDYRGFADSTGTPSEDGLLKDARAVWDWAMVQGAQARDVLLVGQSLGTGVAAALAADLAQQNIHPRGVVLLAPFTSIKTLLKVYNIFGFLPLLTPLQSVPFAMDYVTRYLRHHFNTLSVLSTVKAPILLAHSQDDFDIPSSHSQDLFDVLLEPLLPPLPSLPDSPSQISQISTSDWFSYHRIIEERQGLKMQLVETQGIDDFGQITRFNRSDGGSTVTFVETKWGGHDKIGIQESVMDIMGRVFHLQPHYQTF